MKKIYIKLLLTLTSFKLSVFIFLLGILLSQQLFSANIFWVAASASNWSDPNSWSTTSGGMAPAWVPTAGDNVFFDGAAGAVGNCTLDIDIIINDFNVSSGYSGNIFQSAGVTININNSVWGGGIFTGGNNIITNRGTFTISATDFTSTSTHLLVRNTFTYSGGNFNHNNGFVYFQNNSFAINGSPVFYNLSFTPNYNTLTVNNSFTVANNLIFGNFAAWGIINTAPGVVIKVLGDVHRLETTSILFNVGTIDIEGDLRLNSTFAGDAGSGTYRFTGTGNQNIISTVVATQSQLPNVIINKPSGNLNLSGIITVHGPIWSYISGNIVPGSSTVFFRKSRAIGAPSIIISGIHTLNDVIIESYYSTTIINNDLTANNLTFDAILSHNTIDIKSRLIVNGTLQYTGVEFIRTNTGVIDAYGDITMDNTSMIGGGTATVNIIGTANQALTSSVALGQGRFPSIIINKPSGTLSLIGLITTHGPNWTYITGDLDPTTSTIYYFRDPGRSDITISGTHTLNNIILYPYYSVTTINNDLTVNDILIHGPTFSTVTINSTLTVNGNTTINGIDRVSLNTGTIYANGHITTTNTSATSGGSATFVISGTADQNLTGTGIINQSRLPVNVVLNKPSGYLYISGGVPFHFYNNVAFTNGIMQTTAVQLAIFTAGSAVSGVSNLSHVNGPVRKIGNSAFNFPVGKNGYYGRARISAPATITDHFTAEYFHDDPDPLYSRTLKDPSLGYISACEYWMINRTNGTSNVRVSLFWDTPRSCNTNTYLSEMLVTGWNGSIWKDLGNGGGISGNLNAGSVATTALVSVFGPFTLASNPLLPVDYVSFNAKCIGNNTIEIKWVTSNEKYNDYYEIEHSSDNTNWTRVSTIDQPNNNDRSITKEYVFIDKKPNQENNYYRLKQTDMDAKYSYSNTISVKKCKELDNRFTVLPNPTTGLFYAVYGGDITEFNSIEIYNVLGEKIYHTNSADPVVDITGYNAGIYYVHYVTHESTFVQKITLGN